MRGMPALKRSGSRWRFAGRTPATPHGLLQSGGSGARDQGTDTRGWREVGERFREVGCGTIVGRLWERCGTIVGEVWGVGMTPACMAQWTIGRLDEQAPG